RMDQHRHVLAFLSTRTAYCTAGEEPENRIFQTAGHLGMEALLVFRRSRPQTIRIILMEDADHIALFGICLGAVAPEDLAGPEIANWPLQRRDEVSWVEIV